MNGFFFFLLELGQYSFITTIFKGFIFATRSIELRILSPLTFSGTRIVLFGSFGTALA